MGYKNAFKYADNLKRKLLLNLNIIVSSTEESKIKNNSEKENDFQKVGRNEKCPCGSGKKFKFCHGNI